MASPLERKVLRRWFDGASHIQTFFGIPKMICELLIVLGVISLLLFTALVFITRHLWFIAPAVILLVLVKDLLHSLRPRPIKEARPPSATGLHPSPRAATPVSPAPARRSPASPSQDHQPDLQHLLTEGVAIKERLIEPSFLSVSVMQAAQVKPATETDVLRWEGRVQEALVNEPRKRAVFEQDPPPPSPFYMSIARSTLLASARSRVEFKLDRLEKIMKNDY